MQNPLEFVHADSYELLVWMCVNRCVLPGDCQLGGNSGRLMSMRCLSLLTDLTFGISLGSDAFAVFIISFRASLYQEHLFTCQPGVMQMLQMCWGTDPRTVL